MNFHNASSMPVYVFPIHRAYTGREKYSRPGLAMLDRRADPAVDGESLAPHALDLWKS